MINVAVVDDQAMVRAGLVALLNLESDLHVVGEGETGQDAIEVAQLPGLDVLLLDVEMPQMDGLEALERIRGSACKVAILMLTTFDRHGWVTRALAGGASGFLVKDQQAAQFAEAIRRVHAGMRVVDPDLAARSLGLGQNPLTAREKDVLRAALGGGTSAQVARQVGLSEGTVRNHVTSAMAKTGGSSRMDAARRAHNNGWL